MTTSDGARAACERWFLSRGTPRLIEDYRPTTDVFTRATPVLGLVFLGSVVGAGQLDWGWVANTAAIAGGFAVLLAVWWLINRFRGRPGWQRPDDIGPVELAGFVLGPAILQVVFGGQFRAGLTTAAGLLAFLGSVYVLTSYGVVPLIRWALTEAAREVGAVLGLVVRALPLLLLVNAFLFLNAEMWQVASNLTGAALAASVALFVGIGTVFLTIRLPVEVDRVAISPPAAVDLDDTPAAGFSLGAAPPALTRPERRNLALVLFVSQALQVVIVSLLIAAFFVAFGLIAVAPEVIASWIGGPGDDLTSFDALGREIVLTAELLKVATFLSAFSGLYFTVYVVTDATYREEFFDELLAELRRTIAVRSVYRSA